MAGEGDLVVGVTRGRSDVVPGRGDASYGPAPGRLVYRVVDEVLAPACAGNEAGDEGALCGAAVTTCPADDQVRFWAFHRVREIDTTTDPDTETVLRDWYREPGSYCLGPDDPGVPTIGTVIAEVRRQFARLPLPAATMRTDPGPRTLVGVDTALSAGSAAPVVLDRTLLGVPVRIWATPQQWRWDTGDGTVFTTRTPGVPRERVVTHRYARAGVHRLAVTVQWSGEFSVAGGAERFPVNGTAVVTSAPTVLEVTQARAQHVDPD